MLLLVPILMLFGVFAAPPYASQRPVEACVGDDRGYTLCVAETDFEEADLALNRQWEATISYVEASKGARGARSLRNEQQKWIRSRDRQCEALSAASPVTQQGRNYMSCMATLTEQRTAQLKAGAKSN